MTMTSLTFSGLTATIPTENIFELVESLEVSTLDIHILKQEEKKRGRNKNEAEYCTHDQHANYQ